MLAYLGMYRYYQLYPEYELNKGFADFFFKPSPSAPVMPPFTYLLEVKYAKAGASEKEIRILADEVGYALNEYNAICDIFKRGDTALDNNYIERIQGTYHYQEETQCSLVRTKEQAGRLSYIPSPSHAG